ncbi:MAG: hypothetical protein JST36_02085 [Bacteroidetes bacterium]|nr:hypothetical protein [Bacteroidota bacterium]
MFFLLLLGSTVGYGQSRSNADSSLKARKALLESQRAEQKRVQDSARDARILQIQTLRSKQQAHLDSVRNARQRQMDSLKEQRAERAAELKAIRKHRESRAYRDSIQDAREEKLAIVREAQRAHLDSMKAARQRMTDSMIDAREAATAARRAVQKQRTDSLAAIRKYRTSKRFTDSVAIVRNMRTDSIQERRKAYTDSLTTARKNHLDSMKAARKVLTDSLAAVRKLRTDSLNLKRKARAEASAKREEKRVRDQKIKQKQQEQKFNLALELKIKKKRAVYSNEKMLKKKWTPIRRGFQNTYTHYNYYFNANKKMEEAELNMQRSAKDNWEETIPLFDFDPLKDSTRFASDMDSVIQKTSLGIQIHDPRTKWSDDLYLLLGKAYFYKGDQENAENAFKYIVSINEKAKAEAIKKAKRKGTYKREVPSLATPQQTGLNAVLKRDPATNDGLLWLIRTNTTYGDLEGAESLLDLLHADTKFPEKLKGRLALEHAYLDLKKENWGDARKQLSIVSAAEELPVDLRRRAAYLNGQLLQEDKQYKAAADQFAIVSDLHPKIDLDFYARRNRAYALMQSGGVQADAVASLKSMLNDGKFRTYYEQVYYVLGRLSANSGDTRGAIAYLTEGIQAPKSTKKQKAISFAALGDIYFKQSNYSQAKLAYDSAAHLAQYATDDSSVQQAASRAALVSKVADPSQVIRVQDSLLELAAMPEKEQKLIVKRFIRAYEKQLADSAFLAANAANGTSVGSGGVNSNDPSAQSWYFNTPSMVQQGKAEFKRIWGDRPNVDNWRRAAAIARSGAIGVAGGSTVGDELESSSEINGVPTEETLLGYIPKTDEAKATATNRLQRAYLDLSTAYAKQFHDYKRATAALDTLEQRWPTNSYAAEATYLRYFIALKENRLQDAQAYSTKIRNNYAGTEYGELVGAANTETQTIASATVKVDDYYSTTYQLLQNRQYGEVLGRVRSSRRQFPTDEKYPGRFKMLEAVAYIGSAQYKEADTLLRKFIKESPKDTLIPWAQEILRLAQEKIKSDSNSIRLDSIKLALTKLKPNNGGTDSSASISENEAPPKEYAYEPNAPHYFLFVADKMEPKVMGIKAGLADFNMFSFSEDKLETEILPMANGKALIVVKKFKDQMAAKRYLTMFNKVRMMTREFKPDEYQLMLISAKNFLKLVAEGAIEPYETYYQSHYK